MGARAVWLTLIRVFLVIFSAATFACHVSQIALLGNNSWFPKNYSYILYFVGPGVSTISSLALLFTMLCGIKSIRGDRIIGVLNLALMIATVVLVTLKSGPVPWRTNDDFDSGGPTSGFQPDCRSFRTDLIDYQRCWLSNGMWIGAIVVAAFWLLLVLYVFIQQRGDIYHDDNEYEIYDFKTANHNNDIPMAVTSPAPVAASPLQQDQASSHHGYQQQQQAYYDPSYYSQPSNYAYPDAYNNNGGYGYYVPTESALTTPLEHTNSSHYTNQTPNGSHADDDTTYIMADIGGVDHRPPPSSPPHTPSKSHQIPHAYE